MTRDQLLPSLAVGLSGAMWGLYWMPARWLGGHGIDGLWQAAMLFSLALLAMVPIAVWRWREIRAIGPELLLTGLFTGAAFTLYTASLLLTDVVRALLLFYITPVWSTLLSIILRREIPSALRLLALVLAIGGLLTVLDYASGLPLPRNAGDWLSLIGGMMFAYGSFRNFENEAPSLNGSVLGFNVGGLLGAVLMIALPLEAAGAVPPVEGVRAVASQLAVLALLLFLPTTYLIMWGTHRVDPARVGMLLMVEIVVGVATAAAFADEPFGLREAAGAALILSAGVVDVYGGQRTAGSGKQHDAAG
jgi:drug/metabolite transporter (DMT)-like permease